MMEKPATVVNLNKRVFVKKIKQKTEIVKFFASTNFTHYNMSIELNAQDKAIVNEFSIGFVLQEQVKGVNTKKKGNKSQTKINDENKAEMAIFYNFINIGRIKDFSVVPTWMKFAVYKNVKTMFYGVERTDTTKVNLKAQKAIELLLLIQNIHAQILENEERIKTFQENKKAYPNETTILTALQLELAQRSKLKAEFINIVKNFLKKYF